MNLDDAIKTAIEFEHKVEATYREAVQRAGDPVARRIFETLAKEEQGHIDYLESRLAEWTRSGHMTVEELETAIPARERIQQELRALQEKVTQKKTASGPELEYLQRALEAERQTSSFYQKMVSELSDQGQQLFARFVEIEEGHLAIVQAELDAVSRLGFWFDFQEWQFQDG